MRSASLLTKAMKGQGRAEDLMVINAFGLSLENGLVFLCNKVDVVVFWF